MVGAVLEATESRKHQANDEKCLALGWVSTPLVVDSYGAWGNEASIFLAQIIARLAIHKSLPKAQISFELFANLSICLTRANARAILRRIPLSCFVYSKCCVYDIIIYIIYIYMERSRRF